jgi:hypothetical protein
MTHDTPDAWPQLILAIECPRCGGLSPLLDWPDGTLVLRRTCAGCGVPWPTDALPGLTAQVLDVCRILTKKGRAAELPSDDAVAEGGHDDARKF